MPRTIITSQATRNVALCYLRKSIVRTGTDYASIDMQRAAIAAECSWRGWTTEWYEDAEGHSSGRTETGRPAWQRLKSRISSPDVVAIVGFRLDRIGRSVKDISSLLELCERHGVGVVTADKQIDTTNKINAWTAAQINMTAVFAQLESDMARDRMRERVAVKDAAGINHGKPPFGMIRVGEGNSARFVANDDINAVRQCLELYAGGMSYDDVAERLNCDAVPFRARHGGVAQWGRESVRTVVGNVLRYSGYHIPQTGYDAKANRVVLEGEGDYCDRWARAIGGWASPAVDSVIERQLANSVIERRFKNQLSGRPALHLTFLLTPIAYWEGYKLRGQSRPEGRVYRTYSNGIVINADKAEEYLLSRIEHLRMTNEVREGVRQTLLARSSSERMQAIHQRLNEAKEARSVLVELLLAKSIDRETYDDKYSALEATIRKCQSEIEMPADVELAMKMLSDMGSMIRAMTAEKQKRAIHTIFERVGLSADGEVVQGSYRPMARHLWQAIGTNSAEGGNQGQNLSLPDPLRWWISIGQLPASSTRGLVSDAQTSFGEIA
jgi:DNA invertase Pin-like site-specific DNA recombinase